VDNSCLLEGTRGGALYIYKYQVGGVSGQLPRGKRFVIQLPLKQDS
jgi:hypothetical protein